MKMTVECNSTADLANFSKFIDQRLDEETKNRELENMRGQLSLAKEQLERAYSRLRFKDDKLENIYKLTIDSLPILNRTFNALKAHGIQTIGEAVIENEKSGLRKIINFGKGSYADLQEALAKTHNIVIQR